MVKIMRSVVIRGYQAPDSFHRVTIRDCASNPTSADAATGSGHVLDDDRLAECGPHALGHDARKRIDGPARCERHDHRD